MHEEKNSHTNIHDSNLLITYFIIKSSIASLSYGCHVGFQIHNKPHWSVEDVCSQCACRWY